jgi:hypothetical protein
MPELDFKETGMHASRGISAYILKSLIEKLRPGRFPGMPVEFASFVGFVLGARFSDTGIAEILVSDGRVFARVEGESEPTYLLGHYPDVLRAWLRFVAAAGLNNQEFYEVQCLFALKVGFYGPTNA